MRKLLLLPLVLWACGGSKDAPMDDTAAMADMPAALTAADVTGSYEGTTMAQGPDSMVTSNWTAWVTDDGMGGLSGRIVVSTAPTDTVAFAMKLSGDSTINVSEPFTDRMAPEGSPQMTWVSIGHGNGNAWTGTVAWMAAGSDSVTMTGTWSATRTP